MTKQENMAGTELVVDSIRILKGDGLTGAGAERYERKLNQLEQEVNVIAGKQQDYWSETVSDNVITPTEKQTLKKEKAVIDTEYYSILDRAESAGVTGSQYYDLYVSAYSNLTSYITQIDLFADMTANTTIQSRTRFITLYDDYYENRDNLVDTITKGYIGEAHGLQDTDAVPVLKLSAHTVKVNDDKTVYTPTKITIEGKITNGTYSDPYNCIVEVYRNDNATPSYTSGIIKSMIYDIPDNTTSLRFVMKNVDSRVVYDDESITMLTSDGGLKVDVDNMYQVFVNGTPTKADSDNAPDFKAAVTAYMNAETRNIDKVTVQQEAGIKSSYSNGYVHFTPDSEVKDSGEINVTVNTCAYNPVILGLVSGDTRYILGIGSNALGQSGIQTVKKKITYKNYQSLSYLEQQNAINSLTGSVGNLTEQNIASYYLGKKTSPEQVAAITDKRTGVYFLYAGTSTSSYTKGHLYQWTGSQWKNDESNQHFTVAMSDMFTMLDDTPDLADTFVRNMFASRAIVKYLWTKVITLQDGTDGTLGTIQSEHYDSTTGFKITSDGKAVFNDATIRGSITAESGYFKGTVEADDGVFRGTMVSSNAHISGNSTFEGDINSGPLVLSSTSSPGATYSTTFFRTHVGYINYAYIPPIYDLFKKYDLIGSESNVGNYGKDASFTSKKVTGTSPRSYSYLTCSWSGTRSGEMVTYKCMLQLYDANMKRIAIYTEDCTVSFTISIEGSKTFKLISLPKYASSEKGVVWTNGTDGILRIS